MASQTYCSPSRVSSFDDIFDNVWRPQAQAFNQLIYGSQPPNLEGMTPRQRLAYWSELRRITGELERKNPVLMGLTTRQVRDKLEAERTEQ